MRKRVRRRHDAHVRVDSLCAEHSALFDATPGGQKTRAALAADVADVNRLLGVQEQSIEERRAATAQCEASRRALRTAAKSVVTVGRMVNLGAEVMGTMQLPEASNGDALLAYARGLLGRVSAHADAFVAEGLPPDLLKHLEEAIAQFEAARDAQAASRQRFAGATASIGESLDHADKAVDVLETIVVNTPGGSPDVLTKFRIARRVGPRASTPAPAPTPPQSTSTDKAA